MKTVFVTQRVDTYPDRSERRDALDQRFAQFLHACGFLPVPVPNDSSVAEGLFRTIHPLGVVLSGGNDLVSHGGNAPERDATEAVLTQLCEEQQLPVLGVCRGMQFLAVRGGGTLERIPGHVATRHSLRGTLAREVNSYHGWGVRTLGADWEALATTPDGTIEFAGCTVRRQWGVMWHPERESVFDPADIALFRSLLCA